MFGLCLAALTRGQADQVAYAPKSGEVQPVLAGGIPFIQGSLWENVSEGTCVTLADLNVRAEALYILGCTNSQDAPNLGYWGSGESFVNFFIGDSAGAIRIATRTRDYTIPLIFGYNVWWAGAYADAPEPFASDGQARALLDSALVVANGTDAYKDKTAPYFIKIRLPEKEVTSISFEDNAGKTGYFLVSGLTFEGVQNPAALDTARWRLLPEAQPSEPLRQWLGAHTIDAADPYPAPRRHAIAQVARLLYTYPEDITESVIAATAAQVDPASFPGPKVRFSGSAEASLLTKIYYDNAADMAGRIDPDGMVHESADKAAYHRGPGTWTPGLGAFYGDSYTRLRALTLLTRMGLMQPVHQAIAYFDRWMMYFPQSYPQIQLGGKPVPGHATVVANRPHYYFDKLIHVGDWRTRFKTRDMGNPENDGHGLLMMSRWRAWVKEGRTAQWADERWEALCEAAEYVCWSLEHPELSFSQHGLLYSESEGGMQKCSLFCDYPCYLGLLGYAEMAQCAGYPEQAQRWRAAGGEMFQAMQAYYPRKMEPWGEVWDPDKNSLWTPYHSTLAPIILGMDYWGYDVMNKLPQRWQTVTQNTYARQLTLNSPAWCATMAGMGYGQSFITQAALLLDRMDDAGQMIAWMARFCFSPRLPRPYIVPEGANLLHDGSVWRKWGDLGNLFQQAEVISTIQLMLGIDDIDPAQVSLMPRLPLGWTGLEAQAWPVRTQSDGKPDLIEVSYDLQRDSAGREWKMTLQAQRPIDAWKIRLGPFPAKAQRLRVRLDDAPVAAKLERSGDAQWAWIALNHVQRTHIKLSATVDAGGADK